MIARINLLETFCEYTKARWKEEPSDLELKRIANIISWNLWQMDGIYGVIPYKGSVLENNEENSGLHQLTLFDFMDDIDKLETETIKELPETIDCKIYDWCDNKVITYKSMREG